MLTVKDACWLVERELQLSASFCHQLWHSLCS